MSFVTRCPACATHFKVVSDQLKISDGWVRCGQCGEVFDASAQLAMLPEAAPTPAPTPVSAPLLSDPPPPDTQAGAWTDALAPEPAPQEAAPEPEAWPQPEPEPEPVQPLEPPEPVMPPEPEGDPPPPDDAPDSMYDLPPAAELLPPAPEETSDLEASEAVLSAFPEQVGFVRQAQRRAWWQRPAVRWSLALLSLLLCVGLLLQWVLFERDRIAALRPDLRPALNALCAPLGCQVEPLRWVQALSIESTTLARRGNGRYVLEVVLRNASVFELAMPALELSLTDVRDQLLLRRVILPPELPAAPAAVPASDTLTLRVDVLIDGPVGEALAGYRTLVFYP
ncbi:MAG: zinc-ribbon and DUF3426 domain-containing protein [Ramlibacter sp.]|nr:zinc-ribbon and DUF3426 domain-containing protein [Ramlibacter sp.]